jgi:hypothetical protein
MGPTVSLSSSVRRCIRTGEEITAAYVDPHLPHYERRETCIISTVLRCSRQEAEGMAATSFTSAGEFRYTTGTRFLRMLDDQEAPVTRDGWALICVFNLRFAMILRPEVLIS